MKQTNKILTTLFFLILCWTNSQAQWTRVVSGTINALYDINFPTPDTGYAVGYYGTILKSTDAGTTWTTLVSNTNANCQGVEFLNANTGFVVGDSGIIKTTDGGITWNQISIPVSSSLRDIQFLNSQTGFCVGTNGTILKTTDGGNTWINILSGNFDDILSCVNFPTDSIGYIVATGYHWELKKTIDGGNTWNTITINPNNNTSDLEAVFFTNANTGYIGGWYLAAFIKTTDGGNNWVDKNIPDSTGHLLNLYSIYFPSSVIGYAVGWSSGIVKTNDSGNSWTKQYAPIGNEILYSVYFTNNTMGYIVGTSGIILKTTNGGDVTGIEENNYSENDLAVYPNPFNNELNIQNNSTQVFQFTLYNSLGEKIIDKTLKNKSSTIDLSTYSNDIYFYKLTSDKQLMKSGKIIKQ